MVYGIFHCYDVDGGFGDAIPNRDLLFIINGTEEDAKAYCEKWSKPHIYDRPYAALQIGRLWYKQIMQVDPEDINLSPKDICGEHCLWEAELPKSERRCSNCSVGKNCANRHNLNVHCCEKWR